MSVEENKIIVQRHVEEWSNRNPAVAIDELVATDFVEHDVHGDPEGIDAFRQSYLDEVNARPDCRHIIEHIVAEGDKVAVMLVSRYTNANTGQQSSGTAMNIYRISEGKIQELWSVWR